MVANSRGNLNPELEDTFSVKEKWLLEQRKSGEVAGWPRKSMRVKRERDEERRKVREK
jgi:hypothetical protein